MIFSKVLPEDEALLKIYFQTSIKVTYSENFIKSKSKSPIKSILETFCFLRLFKLLYSYFAGHIFIIRTLSHFPFLCPFFFLALAFFLLRLT